MSVRACLGEDFMEKGDWELATANYGKSLELDANNSNTTEPLKKLGAR